MARQKNIIRKLLVLIKDLLRSALSFGSTTKLKDAGIFDPYSPISSLKTINRAETGHYEEYFNEDANAIFRESNFFIGFVRIVFLVVISLFLIRLTYLQVTKAEDNLLLADNNRLKEYLIPAPRGLILDRRGVVLASNVPSFALAIRASEIPSSKVEYENFIEKVAERAELSQDELSALIKKNAGLDYVTIRESISREEAVRYELRLSDVIGAEIQSVPTRKYSDIPAISHIIGYIGKVNAEDLSRQQELRRDSIIGRSGVEKSYDAALQGAYGADLVEVDSRGNYIRTVSTRQPEIGGTVTLTLDAELQKVAASTLTEEINKNSAKSGAVIALNPKTGEVLASVSYPYYDSNIFIDPSRKNELQSLLSNEGSPLLNRVIAGQYPAGSTIKPLVAAAALQENVINENTKLDTSSGRIEVGQNIFVDWTKHGIADVRQAIAESNNIFFYAVGGGYDKIGGLGVERLSRYLEYFGLGERSGIELAGEQKGLIPNPSWKRSVKKEPWYLGDTYNMSIGQGDVLVTPLQLVRAISVIANNGKLVAPQVVKSITAKDDSISVQPEISKEGFISEDNVRIVKEGMRRTVTSGSARSFNDLPIEVAAKTGTAQFDVKKEKTHSWFTAFAPYNDPSIAIAVIVEGGGEGHAVAAPIARAMLLSYFK